MATPAERFWAKVSKAPGDGCWEWTAAKYSNGYGAFQYFHGKVSVAHRWAYAAEFGPIPDTLVLDHLCRNVACVRPSHLEAVTQRQNVHRGLAMVIGPRRKDTCRQGHALTPDNVETRRGGGRRCVTCRRVRENDYKARRRAAAKVA